MTQIVGYQNSGKTTLIKKVIQQLTIKGKKIITIKHHGHGGKPELNENKDASQHVSAGAIASLVEGEGRMILHGEKINLRLNEQIQLVSFFQPDLILVEGYKKETYPKIVIVRNKDDFHLLKKLSNIIFVYYWNEKPDFVTDIPTIPIQNEHAEDKIIHYLIHHI